MKNRICKNSADSFCYICREFIIKKHQRNITKFVKGVYLAYFVTIIRDQDKSWALHKVCYICVEDLRKWSKKEKTAFRFAIPMIWREAINHCYDCYFCSVDVIGYNTKNKREIIYPNIRLMEKRYQGCWNINMMADYCWSLQREIKQPLHNRRSNTRSFSDMRKRKRQLM